MEILLQLQEQIKCVHDDVADVKTLINGAWMEIEALKREMTYPRLVTACINIILLLLSYFYYYYYYYFLSIKLLQKTALEYNYQNLIVTVEKQIHTMNH